MSRLHSQQGLVGPLIFLPNMDLTDNNDRGTLLSPFRFTERECGVTLAGMTAFQKGEGTKDHDEGQTWRQAPTRGTRGEFCPIAGLVTAVNACFGDGGYQDGQGGATREVVMVVELRFEKTLSAWVEASRGLILRAGLLRPSQSGAVPC